MRDLRAKRNRLIQTINKYESHYTFSNKNEYLIISSGILSFIWNNWNNFWRDYFLSHINGGFYINNNPINKFFACDDKEALHYLCHLNGRYRNHNIGDRIRGSYQEITWGDYDKIVDIGSQLMLLQPINTHLSYMVSLISTYQSEIKHIQEIRNSFIHLNNETIDKLNNLRAYYIFDSNQSVIDILESNHIGSNKKCIYHILDNLKGFLMNL